MRYDPIHDTWIAISEKRKARPTDFSAASPKKKKQPHSSTCPFCEGNEFSTPFELDAVPQKPSPENFHSSSLQKSPNVREKEETLDNYRRPNGPGWVVRAVPNRYPFLESGQEKTLQKFGPYFSAVNAGRQEVLIDIPFHETNFSEMDEGQFQYLVHFFHRRLHQARKEGKWRYVQLFKNQGSQAGASLSHLHSQLAALPFVPPALAKEQRFLSDYHQKNGKCFHCEVLEYERNERWRAIRETEHFLVFCPFASRYAGEIQIMPKRHVPCFVQSHREEIDDLALTLRKTIIALEKVLPESDFNLVLKTSPWDIEKGEVKADPYFHWRMEICPRITKQAGFEIGTGCFVNPIAPETMAASMAQIWE
ncbi:MAG: DUF4921 family protein [Planctomycetaceae bacterium]|nr:DUF4921 family protein [Planctomycetaceae bacterium]MBQ2820923.1 DUF4921 family protein [Thermoguttaceae bacterium]MDO4424575.1 DUF4921 family protein [Planctomycetia bacterium]